MHFDVPVPGPIAYLLNIKVVNGYCLNKVPIFSTFWRNQVLHSYFSYLTSHTTKKYWGCWGLWEASKLCGKWFCEALILPSKKRPWKLIFCQFSRSSRLWCCYDKLLGRHMPSIPNFKYFGLLGLGVLRLGLENNYYNNTWSCLKSLFNTLREVKN